MAELPIKLIPNELYKQLFQSEQAVCPDITANVILDELESKGLGGVTDNSTMPNIPIPIPLLDKPLPEWIEHNAQAIYGRYHKVNDKFAELPIGEFDPYTLKHKLIGVDDIEIPDKAPPNGGWWKADYIDGSYHWVKVNTLPKNLILDFETTPTKVPYKYRAEWLPFICCAIDEGGDFYCWRYENISDLPRTVNFPGLEYGIGHNAVGYDRRYITEAYKFDTKLRMFDTYAMYHLLMGMASTTQRVIYTASKKGEFTPDWCEQTSEGGLGALYEHFTGEKLDKSTRENIKASTPDYIENNIDEIFQYCLKDVFATVTVFSELWNLWKQSCPSIVTLGGQIERSIFRMGVVKDYHKRLAAIDKQILEIKIKRNEQILGWLEASKDYPPLKQYGEAWIEREWQGRKKKAQNPDRCQPKDWQGFIKSLWKKPDSEEKLAITPEKYISINSRAIVYALQIHWEGKQLQWNGETWGIYEDITDCGYTHTKFKAIPNPKGDGNVGTPLSKDFKSKAITKEFYSLCGFDLKEIYEVISTISTWISFRDRMYDAYIVDNIWLTDNVPCGTVSERMVGTAVVLPNCKPDKAGTEVKHLFKVTHPDHLKIDGDYASQENLIFAGIADTKRGYIGSTPTSVLTLSGTDAHDRTGNIILDMLNPDQIAALEKSYGTPLLKKLRVLWKNINYANQFLCGKNKQASQIYLAVQGQLPYDKCFEIANAFIDESRGVMNYGKYENGFASPAYNGCKENSNQPIQKSFIYNRNISVALQKRYCGKEFATTRFNFNIQQTGQEMINTCLVVKRILQTIIHQQQGKYIPYHTMNMVHDQCLFEYHKMHFKNGMWLFQIGHMFSKCIFYSRIGIEQVPITGLFLDTIELDHIWRKDPAEEGVTPSKLKPSLPLGAVVLANKCVPKDIGMVMQSLEVIDDVEVPNFIRQS